MSRAVENEGGALVRTTVTLTFEPDQEIEVERTELEELRRQGVIHHFVTADPALEEAEGSEPSEGESGDESGVPSSEKDGKKSGKPDKSTEDEGSGS